MCITDTYETTAETIPVWYSRKYKPRHGRQSLLPPGRIIPHARLLPPGHPPHHCPSRKQIIGLLSRRAPRN